MKRAQGCNTTEMQVLVLKNRKNGQIRWEAVKTLVQKGRLPQDFVEEKDTF